MYNYFKNKAPYQIKKNEILNNELCYSMAFYNGDVLARQDYNLDNDNDAFSESTRLVSRPSSQANFNVWN